MYWFIFHIQYSIAHTDVVANPGGPKSGLGTPFSVSDTMDLDTDRLLEMMNNDEKYGKRKQAILKALVRFRLLQLFVGNPSWDADDIVAQAYKRDGFECAFTGITFIGFNEEGVTPILTHIVPHSFHDKVSASFSGKDALDLFLNVSLIP